MPTSVSPPAPVPTPAEDRKAQWSILSLLRFVLAYIVFCSHVPPEYFYRHPFLNWTAWGGSAAVTGFLLLSGFSIAASLAREPGQFYQRRILRIYPLYFCAIGLAQAAAWYLGPRLHSAGLLTTVGNLLLLQGVACIPIVADRAVWSLSVEFFYYLLAPWLFKLSYRTWMLLVLLSGLVFAYREGGFIRLESTFLHGYDHAAYLWVWLLGFGYYLRKGLTTVILMLAGTALVVWAFYAHADYSAATYLISVLAILVAPRWKIPRPVAAVLQYLGDLSYPLYLFHPIVIAVLTLGANKQGLLVIMASVAVVTLFFYHVVDVFIKRRFLAPWLLGHAARIRSS